MSQKPTVGRSVHYQAHGSPDGTHKPAPRAATITEVISDTEVGLCVMNPTGLFFNRSHLDESETPKGGTWHWPPRV